MADASSLFPSERRSPDRQRRANPFRVLLLAGAHEARQIAFSLTRDPRIVPIASLARSERSPTGLGLPSRIGGWGGRSAFVSYLKAKRIDGIIDATHPFATRISHRAAEVADAERLDYIQFLRPAWRPKADDRWVFLNREEDAARHVPADARVFLATGLKRLDAFEGLAGRDILCRVRDLPDDAFPYSPGRFVVDNGPRSIDSEMRLFENLDVDWLVVRNSGGLESRTKLDAAREMGIPVAMVRRPPQPDASRAETVSEVIAWVRRRLLP
ncbi:MAG: precorrin-6A/cobalt-precorrin-6A reductase [Pseudomonadota bacterium]